MKTYPFYYVIPDGIEPNRHCIQARDGEDDHIVAECHNLAEADGMIHLLNTNAKMHDALERLLLRFQSYGDAIDDLFGDDEEMTAAFDDLEAILKPGLETK